MTAIDVDKTVRALNRMTVTQLRERYSEVFGEATRSHNKQYLIKRIAWRLQAMQEGDLSERARRRAKELANDADLRIRPPLVPPSPGSNGGVVTSPLHVNANDRLPMPGTLLKREYKGKTIQVRVLPNGFDYDGDVYRSLSAVARKVTGAHWNGYHFFQLLRLRKEAE